MMNASTTTPVQLATDAWTTSATRNIAVAKAKRAAAAWVTSAASALATSSACLTCVWHCRAGGTASDAATTAIPCVARTWSASTAVATKSPASTQRGTNRTFPSPSLCARDRPISLKSRYPNSHCSPRAQLLSLPLDD